MRYYSQYSTIAGVVTNCDLQQKSFTLKCRDGGLFNVRLGEETLFRVLENLDRVVRDRVDELQGIDRNKDPLAYDMQKYIRDNEYLVIEGIYQEVDSSRWLDARDVHLLHHRTGEYLFEETHWWLVQISQLADRWLDQLFDTKRHYEINDFSKFYRTNLNIEGMPVNDNVQECATLSRLVYGLSSAYLLTGAERFYLAARSGVQYQREAFRSLSHDGRHIFWASGRRRNVDNTEQLIVASENDDDRGAVPLYEQIYALAGLVQFYRISLDWETLEDIRRTVATFQAFFHDDANAQRQPSFPGYGGYFSHLDPATMRPDTAGLQPRPGDKRGDNQSRKNFNSIVDHISAYLVNLILALDPTPQGGSQRSLEEFLGVCRGILEETSDLIVQKFPDRDPAVPFVNERFLANWEPDHKWGWQQNRAIVGHNLKIAWNLTRSAHYFRSLERHYRDRHSDGKAKEYADRADKALNEARRIARKMAEVGAVDRIRGGVFDAVERKPSSGRPVEFVWGNTKDFWQQEQGILAYLILHGAEENDNEFLDLARESMAFWNLFFIDRDRQGIFFRTTESGAPIIRDPYGRKGSHSISGYHAFELNYLAHLYIRGYYRPTNLGDTNDTNFCLYFKVSPNRDQESINVLPDFFPPGHLKINSIRENGVDVTEERLPEHADFFRVSVPIREHEVELVVEFGRTNAN